MTAATQVILITNCQLCRVMTSLSMKKKKKTSPCDKNENKNVETNGNFCLLCVKYFSNTFLNVI